MLQRHRSCKGNMYEMSWALFIAIAIFVFPLIDLLGMAIGAATVCLIARQTSIRAATQQRFDSALLAIEEEASLMSRTGLARFARLRPLGGYNGCGVDLYIDATNYVNGDRKQYGPNLPAPPPIDTSSWLYQCVSQVSYEVGPTINLSVLPWIGTVPGLGRPHIVTVRISRTAEYPQGFQNTSGLSTIGGTMPATLDATPIGSTSPGGGRSGWNFPNIYDIIAGAGQTVVTEDVLVIPSINPNWTSTNIRVAPGDKLWIDYRADGEWTLTPNWDSTTDADGLASLNNDGFRLGSMIGKIDNGNAFFLGKQKWNFPPPNSGQLYMKCNDYYYVDNVGVVTARIIVAR